MTCTTLANADVDDDIKGHRRDMIVLDFIPYHPLLSDMEIYILTESNENKISIFEGVYAD